jgi:hypothetical protein
MHLKISGILKLSIISYCMMISANSFSQKMGIFEGQTDVGNVLHAGNAIHNTSEDDYSVSGSGTNIWFTNDEFHFVWKKMKGDFILRALG